MTRKRIGSLLPCGLSFSLGVFLTYICLNYISMKETAVIYQPNQSLVRRPSGMHDDLSSVLNYGTKNVDNKLNELNTSGPRKILLDCGGNMASTVELFRETYPDGKNFIIHSFEIDVRLAPYFSPYRDHYLHCPVGVAERDGNMTAFSESVWSPDKGKNNGRDMQWGGGTLFVDKKELTDTNTGGRRKLAVRKTIPVVDLSRWIKENTRKEDYVIFKLDVEGAEYRILKKMLEDGTFAWIDKYYGEYHNSQPVGLSSGEKGKIINNVKTKGKKMYDWGAEIRNYADFEALHPTKIPEEAPGKAGAVYSKCNTPKHLAIAINVGMSRKQAVKVMSILAYHRTKVPVTVFVYSEFAEEWPDLVKFWATVYNIGLRGNHPYPTGHFEMMAANWIREAVVSSEMRLRELDINPIFYSPNEYGENVQQQLKHRGFRIIKAAVNFPPKSEPLLTVQNYYKFRDVERVPKALRTISNRLQTADGGILSLDTDLPDTYMNFVFLLDYLVEKSGYTLVSLNECVR
ncbi:uncharacterized protein LOC117103711 [Anneissia japonica]|uniref:uncharacterized protein LOC117103711 n=1 Tax=Anneissia japonica TaxID=1529436 RepID=UPI001425928C|nr:uncharacterized protein LOC117103711 [Anneissia japonica]